MIKQNFTISFNNLTSQEKHEWQEQFHSHPNVSELTTWEYELDSATVTLDIPESLEYSDQSQYARKVLHDIGLVSDSLLPRVSVIPVHEKEKSSCQ